MTIALLFAWRQLRQSADIRRDQSRAYVVAFLEFPVELREFPLLVVQNLGTTAAYDIRLSSEPSLRSSFDAGPGPSLAEVGMLRSGIPMLAPGQRITTIFDSTIDRPDDWEDTYVVEVAYSDRSGNHWTDSCRLDLSAIKSGTYMGERGLRSIDRHLEELVDEFHSLRTGFGGPLPVEVEDRATRRSRVAAEPRHGSRSTRRSDERSLRTRASYPTWTCHGLMANS